MPNRYLSIVIFLCFFACKRVGNDVNSQASSTKVETRFEKKNLNIGDTLDVFNDVYVIYNKSMNNTSGRHLTKDNYNLGLKWQCVEFVKRYYYNFLHHKMPNTYGHAKDFFNPLLSDGKLNRDRNLIQFVNSNKSKPQVHDLIVFDGNVFNPYGHVAIISKIGEDYIEIIQQNVGKTSRDTINLEHENSKWYIGDSSVLGWLRKK